jgi:hypothetical protein
MTVDLFTIAGERVKSLEATVDVVPYDGSYQQTDKNPAWDMTNAAGEAVASGVYIAVARLYCGQFNNELLAENKVKVAVIR